MRCVGGSEHVGEIINDKKALIGISEEEISWKSSGRRQNYFITNLRGVSYVILVLVNLIWLSVYWWALVNGGRKIWVPYAGYTGWIKDRKKR